MIEKKKGYLVISDGDVPDESRQLEIEGYAVIERVLSPDEVAALKAEIDDLYASTEPDTRNPQKAPEVAAQFRYAMFNRSELARHAVAHPRILSVIEPLLGNDCHVIANTCWRNPPTGAAAAGAWHVDAGPHVPLEQGQVWPDEIPHPVFAIGAHILLEDCPLACGPTSVIPRSHLSGLAPPADRVMDDDLDWCGALGVPLAGRAGDVACFVSDTWHRRMPPTEGDTGRFFLQAHYGRRDIAQRVRPTAEINHVDPNVAATFKTPRERQLFGLHGMGFYDA